MKVAYLILAHDNPRHLQRLVRALASPSSACFIHVDRKADLNDFLPLDEANVVLSRRRWSVYGGDFSVVRATMVLMRQALADSRGFDRFVLLSGTHYPLHSAACIEQFFQRNATTEFISLVDMPVWHKPLSRLVDYRASPHDPPLVKLARAVKARLGIATKPRRRNYRKYPGDLVPYAGGTWWALSRNACSFIQSFVDSSPRIVRYFRNTTIADEMLFQIILGNSHFRRRIRNGLTYVDWSAGGAHPAWIDNSHVQHMTHAALELESSGTADDGAKLFARKFSDASEQVVTHLNRVVEQKTVRSRSA